jgi:CBS domain containing-hemolysin-like protein
MNPLWISLPIVAALLLLMGVFALAETALLALRSSRVEQLVEEGRRGARSVQRLSENPTRYLAACQGATTLFGSAAAGMAATVVALYDGSPGLSERVVRIALTTLLVAGAAMAVGGLVPKAVALRSPDVWALRLARLVEITSVLFRPFTGLALFLARLFVPGAKLTAPMVTREEFEKIAQDSGKAGEIDNEEAKIITKVMDLSETPVRAVMTPRTDMTVVPVDAPVSEVLDAIISSGHTRIPVFEGTIDNIVGVLNAKDLLPLFYAEKAKIELRHALRQPYFVNETQKVSETLQQLRRRRQHLAIVQDEFAGTEGLVTLEDLLEEIVGEIQDETDLDEPEVTVLSSTESLVDGRMSLDDLNDRLGLSLEHDDYDTIGGLIFGQLGREPIRGEGVTLGELRFTVEEIEGRRVKKVRVIKTPP